MKTSEILDLDYRKMENKVMIAKALKKIEMFQCCTGKIPIEMLEEYIVDCERKYSMMINYICPIITNGIFRYCATIKEKENQEITNYIYACCIFELYAKICILYYSKIKNSKCKKIDWKELDEKRKRRLGS